MSKNSSARAARNENRNRLKLLIEQYGSLLTPKQLAMAREYAIDELSFSEIARRHTVSRQAVHESVRAAEKVLSDYAAKLSHLSAAKSDTPREADIREVVSKLEKLKMKIARTGIIYSVDWIRREIDSVMGILADESGEARAQEETRDTTLDSLEEADAAHEKQSVEK